MHYKVKRFLLKSRFSKAAGMCYNAAVSLEMAAVRSLDSIRGPEKNSGKVSLESLTAVIKTFERPHVLKRLVRSIKRCYPDLNIIVVDDSRKSRPLPGVKWLSLPFDSGVSAGRSAGLSRVETPYILLLDDDFILYSRTGLRAALKEMEMYPQIDIMGGAVVNLPFVKISDYRNAGLFSTAKEPVQRPGSYIGPFPVYDKVPNFYIAQTERLRLVDWDPQIKRLDHADFFTRARGVLTTVYNDKLRCLHAKTPFDRHYMSYRGDLESDALVLHRHYHGRR